jgi:hypothetical protein
MNEKDLQLFSQSEEASPTAPTGLEETGLSGLFSNAEKGRVQILNKMISDLHSYPSVARFADRIHKHALASANWFKGDTRIQDLVGKLMRAGTDSDLIAKELEKLLRGMVIELAKQQKQVPVQKETLNELEGPVEPLGETPAEEEPQFVGEQERAKLYRDLTYASINLKEWSGMLIEILNMFLTQEQKQTYANYFEKTKQSAAKVNEIIDKLNVGSVKEDNNPEPISEDLIKEMLIKSKIRGFLNEEIGKLMAVPAINKGPEIQEEEEDSEKGTDEKTLEEEKEELK